MCGLNMDSEGSFCELLGQISSDVNIECKRSLIVPLNANDVNIFFYVEINYISIIRLNYINVKYVDE